MALHSVNPSRITLFFLALFIVFLSVSEASAQTDLERAVEQTEQIQRNRTSAEQQRRLESESLRRQAPSGVHVQAPELGDTPEGEECVDIKTISVEGVTLFKPDLIDDMLQTSTARCIGLTELNNILKLLTHLYIEEGYVTSRAYIPEQDLTDGSLEIVVQEGVLKEMVMNDQPGGYRGQLATAFPGMLGKPLNLRDIEQGLDQINRLQSNDATIELRAGEELGETILAIEREQGKRWHVAIGLDNLGSTATGKLQTRLNGWLDDILGLNEQWSFSYQHSSEDNYLDFDNTSPQSRAYTAGLSLPYGYWTFGIDGYWSEYDSSIIGTYSDIETSGSSKYINLEISRVIHRDQISKTSLTGRLSRKDNENFILGNRIDVSSRVLTVGSIELSHARQLLGGQLAGTVGYHHGLDLFGAFDDRTAMSGSPKGQFEKTVLSLSYFRPFRVGELVATYSGSLAGQWSPDLLFGSEQMSLGGYSTVRGLREAVVFGNRAALTQHELALQLPPFNSTSVAKWLGQFETYVAVDYGKVFTQSEHQIDGGELTGATIGLRSAGGKISFDISLSDIVGSTHNLEPAVSDSGLFYATATMSF